MTLYIKTAKILLIMQTLKIKKTLRRKSGAIVTTVTQKPKYIAIKCLVLQLKSSI